MCEVLQKVFPNVFFLNLFAIADHVYRTYCAGKAGNIEDMLCNMTYVTPTGTYTKSNLWPRISNGPDMHNIVMGSEGNFGIITEAVIRVRPIPQVKIFDSVIFHNYEIGIKFMKAVSQTQSWPSSIRLVDNTQF